MHLVTQCVKREHAGWGQQIFNVSKANALTRFFSLPTLPWPSQEILSHLLTRRAKAGDFRGVSLLVLQQAVVELMHIILRKTLLCSLDLADWLQIKVFSGSDLGSLITCVWLGAVNGRCMTHTGHCEHSCLFLPSHTKCFCTKLSWKVVYGRMKSFCRMCFLKCSINSAWYQLCLFHWTVFLTWYFVGMFRFQPLSAFPK